MASTETTTGAEANESKARRTLQLRFAGVGGRTPAKSTAETTGPEHPRRAPRSATPVTVIEADAETQAENARLGLTKVATGDMRPRHVDFDQIASTPPGHSVWRISYGIDFTGGLTGQSEDIEFQILKPDGVGDIDSAGTFTGSLDGLAGGFVFESEGVQHADGSFVMKFVIVPGTGHGRLTGLTGRYTVVATREHCQPADTPETCETLVSYTLAYRLPRRKN